MCLVVTFARDITVLTQLQEEMTAQKKLIEQFHDRLAFLAREQTRELVPVFESREMKEVMSLVERFASSDATVLILGETGVGKDVVARLTHELSPRKEKMFLKVDCGGISGKPHRVGTLRLHAGSLHRRGQQRARAAISKWPTAARCFSTKSAN